MTKVEIGDEEISISSPPRTHVSTVKHGDPAHDPVPKPTSRMPVAWSGSDATIGGRYRDDRDTGQQNPTLNAAQFLHRSGP